MVHITQSTRPIKASEIVRKWHLVDAKNKILGRTTSKIATILQGKNKRSYVSYLDCGDYVVVINAKEVKLSGNKQNQKLYNSYSGYPGGRRIIKFSDMMTQNPTQIIRVAVSGMLPKNKLRDKQLARLYIYQDENNPHGAKFKGVSENK